MAIQTTNILALATPTTTYTSTNDNALTFMSICNYHATETITCDVHIVPSGGSADNTNLFIKEIEIVAGDTYVVYQGNEKLVLGNTDFVVVEAITGVAVTITIITSYMAV